MRGKPLLMPSNLAKRCVFELNIFKIGFNGAIFFDQALKSTEKLRGRAGELTRAYMNKTEAWKPFLKQQRAKQALNGAFPQ
jgi:hypothetical protein